MAKKMKSTVEKAARPDLNRRQRREMAKRIREASTFSTEELKKEVTEHPNGLLSIACCVDYKWPLFSEKYGLEAPKREEGMSDEDWAREEQAYKNFITSEKNVAKFWYLMGLQHHGETHKQFLEALNSNPSEEAQETENTQQDAEIGQ